jgi:hypothetical protein
VPNLKHFGLCEPWPLADGAAVAVDADGADATAVAVDAADDTAVAVDAVGAAPAAVDADNAGPAGGDERAVKDEQPPHPPHPEMCSGLLYILRSAVAIRLRGN